MKFLYHFDFEMCFAQRPRAPNFQPCSHTEPFVPFWLRNMFSGHSCVHFEHLNLNSQNAPIMVCFVRFDLEMCFAPQPRTPFRHLNFQVWFGAAVFLTFLTFKSASRHTGAQFLISHSLKWLRTHRFSKQIYFSTLCFASFLPFWRTLFFFSTDSFSSLIFFFLSLLWSSFFSLFLFSDSAASSVHIVGRCRKCDF